MKRFQVSEDRYGFFVKDTDTGKRDSKYYARERDAVNAAIKRNEQVSQLHYTNLAKGNRLNARLFSDPGAGGAVGYVRGHQVW